MGGVCVYKGKHYMSDLYLQLRTFSTLYQCPQPKAAFKNTHKTQMLQVTASCRNKIPKNNKVLYLQQAKLDAPRSPNKHKIKFLNKMLVY